MQLTDLILISYIVNAKKNKYSFFNKYSKKDNFQLRLPNVTTNRLTIECESSIKYLRVRIDENLTWTDHIHTIEKKSKKL